MSYESSAQPFELSQTEPLQVGMKEWSKSTSESPILETKGLGPCIGIAIYDPGTKTGHLAHIAIPMFEQPAIKAMLDSVVTSTLSLSDLRIWVRGGQRSAAMAESFDMPQMGRDLINNQLTALGVPEANMDIRFDDVEMGLRSTAMSLDTENGTFQTTEKLSEQGMQLLGATVMHQEVNVEIV